MSSSSPLTVTRQIKADRTRVWEALTDPELISEWMMGAEVRSDWKPGSSITWSGHYQGRSFEDRGEVIEIDRATSLVHTHFSPLSGAEDVPENYHRIHWKLADVDGSAGVTRLTLKMPVDSDQERAEFKKNWGSTLDTLKDVAERRSEPR